jgi:hypothetical protein
MTQGGGSPINEFGAIPFVTIEDAKVIAGIVFAVRQRFVVPKSDSIDIVLDPTAFTGQELVFQPLGFDGIGGPFHIDIYAGITANSDGTPVLITNKNFKSGNIAQVVAQLDPTGVTIPPEAVGPIQLLVPSNGTGAVGSSGASASDAIVNVLDHNIKYLIRITNVDTVNDGTIEVKTDHFEVPQPT